MMQLVNLQEVIGIIGRCCPQCRAAAMERLSTLETVGTHSPLGMGLRSMLSELCIKHSVSFADVVGPCHDKNLIAVRREFAHIARAQGCSFPRIGRILHRHHSTVIHYFKYL